MWTPAVQTDVRPGMWRDSGVYSAVEKLWDQDLFLDQGGFWFREVMNTRQQGPFSESGSEQHRWSRPCYLKNKLTSTVLQGPGPGAGHTTHKSRWRARGLHMESARLPGPHAHPPCFTVAMTTRLPATAAGAGRWGCQVSPAPGPRSVVTQLHPPDHRLWEDGGADEE